MNINTKKYIESFIKIRNKNSEIVPLKFNAPQQRLYDEIKRQKELGKPVRIIILKARQMGFSTETEAVIFKDTVTHFNVNSGIVAHKDDSTNNLFNMSKLMYECLPAEIKPKKKASNSKELIFDTNDGKGLKSKIKVMTAGGDGIGRSDTFNNLHISEYAFWGKNKKDQLVGLLQSVPNLPNTMIIIESTANGYEDFKDFWDKSVAGENDFVPLFIGWNELKDYSMPYDGFELTKEEQELKTNYNLTNEQLSWRRWCIKNNCDGDINLFKQEYPTCPEEAFLSTGDCIFDKEKIINRIAELRKRKEPIKQGSFIYDFHNNTISNIKWIDDPKGIIKIYEEPRKNVLYGIGGDTAGEGSDNFASQVIENFTGKQVAILWGKIDEDLYAKQMYCLGKYYNMALLGIEANFSSYPIKELQKYRYPKQYVREKEDKITGKKEKSYGFKTTTVTRPVIIAELVKILREEIENINDIPTLEEALTFIKNEKGKPEAQQGKHDDLIMSLAIGYRIMEQVNSGWQVSNTKLM